MANVYNLDGVKTEIMKALDIAETRLTAWEKVKFITKKDGKPFAQLSKNISGATVKNNEYSIQPGEKILCVYCGLSKYSGYTSDDIYLYEIARYIKDPEKLNKPYNLLPKNPYLEQIYVYDIEDIKKAVEKRIAVLKTQIEAYKKQFENAETAYKTFEKAFSEALQNLATNTESNKSSYLYYLIKDTITKRA